MFWLNSRIPTSNFTLERSNSGPAGANSKPGRLNSSPSVKRRVKVVEFYPVLQNGEFYTSRS